MAPNDKRRTIEELNDPDYNYFLFFNIGLDEKRESEIKKLVTAKLNNPDNPDRITKLKQDIQEVMFNDAIYDANSGSYIPKKGGRQEEANRAKKFKTKELLL